MDQEYRPTLKSWFNPTPEEMAANKRILFSLQGRVGRRTYWIFAVAPALVFAVLARKIHEKLPPNSNNVL